MDYEKQGEQKPVEEIKGNNGEISPNIKWSEEDELMLESIIQTLKLTNGAAQIKIDWLKSLKDRVLSQPKPEETFERMKRSLIELAQKEQQMTANTADAMIGLPYENKDGGYTHLVDVSRPLPVGNNKIAIIFKED